MPTYYSLASQGFYEPWKILGQNLQAYQQRKVQRQGMAQQERQFQAQQKLREAAAGRQQKMFELELPAAEMQLQEAQRAQQIRDIPGQTKFAPDLRLPMAALQPEQRQSVQKTYQAAYPDLNLSPLEISQIHAQQTPGATAPPPAGQRYTSMNVDPITGQPLSATTAPAVPGAAGQPQVQAVADPNTNLPLGSIVTMTDPTTGATKQQFVADKGEQAKALTEAQTNSTMHSGRMLFNNALYDFQGGDAELSGRAATFLKMMPENFRSQDLKGAMGAMGGFITSVLRRESGAAISKDEFKRYAREFFPMPGDGPEVVAQKRFARALATDLMVSSAGAGAQQARQFAASQLQAFAQQSGRQVPPEVIAGIQGTLKHQAAASDVQRVAQTLEEAAATPRKVTSAEEVMAMPIGAIGIDERGDKFIIRQKEDGTRYPEMIQ